MSMVGKDTIDAGMGRHHAHLDQRDAVCAINPECNAVSYISVPNSGNRSTIAEANMAGIQDNNEMNSVSEEWPPVFGYLDLFLAFVGIAVFLMDLVTDWWLVYDYYTKQEILLLGVTVSFIVTPSVISIIISIIWYSLEHKWTNLGTNKGNLIFRILFTVLQLGRVYRLAEYILYVIRSWSCCTRDAARSRHMREKAIEQKVDAAILGLVDGFLESALQLLLQLYLSMKLHITMDAQRVVTMVLSWLSAAIAITIYYRDNRKARKDKVNIGYCGSFIYLLWRICELGPRFVLLAMCGVMFIPWCFIFVSIHFVLMVVFYAYQKPELTGICCTGTSGLPFLVLMGFISIFGFVNLKEGDTKRTTVVYYLLFYIENAVMASLVLCHSYTNYMVLGKWTHAVYMLFAGAVLHLIFQLLFYKYFHPHKDPICRL